MRLRRLLGLAVVLTAVAPAAVLAASHPHTGSVCSMAEAGALAEKYDMGDANYGRVAQVICGPFTGPHSNALAATGKTTATFYSPSRNLACEMDDGRSGIPNEVYCQSLKAPHRVRMGLDGRLKTCRGERCLGNPGENTPVLPYGKQVTVGRFRCFSSSPASSASSSARGRGF